MPLGMEVGLGPGHIVLDGDSCAILYSCASVDKISTDKKRRAAYLRQWRFLCRIIFTNDFKADYNAIA